MQSVSIRVLNRTELPGFRPYLLPEAVEGIRRQDPAQISIGAVLGRNSVGAAALRLTEEGARLLCLFVDETVRGQGIGGQLLQALLEALPEETAWVEAGYVLGQPALSHMDALLNRAGFTPPETRSQVFVTHAFAYRGDRLLGRAMEPSYRTPENVFPFSELSEELLEELAGAEDVPGLLSWETNRHRAEADLSVALVQEGRVLAYLLCGEGGEDGFLILAALRREGAPASAFLTLLVEMGNRCYYRRGGDFPLYFSALSERVARLGKKIMGDRFEEYEEHTCVLYRELEEHGEENSLQSREDRTTIKN